MENNEILALPAECWRWYDGYVNLYQVSTRGQVRGVDRWETFKDGSKRFCKGRILKPQRNKKTGYLQVTLWRNGKPRTLKVHRMVAETWIDNPKNKPQVNHRDENKANNDVYNLEWATSKENVNYGTRNKRSAASQSKAVLALDPKTGLVVREFPSAMEAGRNGFHQAAVFRCCRGEQRLHKGYKWRYKP